jgi:hypothetical protein
MVLKERTSNNLARIRESLKQAGVRAKRTDFKQSKVTSICWGNSTSDILRLLLRRQLRQQLHNYPLDVIVWTDRFFTFQSFFYHFLNVLLSLFIYLYLVSDLVVLEGSNKPNSTASLALAGSDINFNNSEGLLLNLKRTSAGKSSNKE